MSQSSSATVVAPAQSSPAATSTPVDPSTSNTTPTSSSSIPTSTTPTTSAAPGSSSAVSSPSSILSSSAATTSSTTAASSATTSSTTSSRSRETSSSSFSFIVETSNGQVFTRTSIVTVPFSTPTDTSNTRSSTGFLHNKGAVAGVFSVAGVIVLVALFFLFTSFIRRRRARKLDREIDEAAAAAAAAQLPDFDDFDYTSGTGAGYGPYSETSHGTYNQPPLSHETPNNLGDIPAPYEPYGMTGQAAGAAGIGARGRSVRGGGAQDPFGALSNPPEQYEMYERRQSWTQGIPRGGPGVAPYDLIQAAGLNDGDPYAVARATSQRLNHSQSQSGMSGPTRSQSQGTSILPPSMESHPMPTPAPGYPGSQDTPYPAEKARYSASYAPGGGISIMPPDVDEEAYSGYQDQPSASLDNPYSPGFAGLGAQDEQQEVAGEHEDVPYPHEDGEPARASLADDEDYGYNSGHRVLRVANA